MASVILTSDKTSHDTSVNIYRGYAIKQFIKLCKEHVSNINVYIKFIYKPTLYKNSSSGIVKEFLYDPSYNSLYNIEKDILNYENDAISDYKREYIELTSNSESDATYEYDTDSSTSSISSTSYSSTDDNTDCNILINDNSTSDSSNDDNNIVVNNDSISDPSNDDNNINSISDPE